MIINRKKQKRFKRKRRIRKYISGTPERPRLTVYKSARNIYAQVIDDTLGQTIISASTLDKELRGSILGIKKIEAAQKVGELLVQRCIKKNIQKVVFDCNGYTYHGRIAKLAQTARDKGLSF